MKINLFNKYRITMNINPYFAFDKVELRQGLCSKNFYDDSHCLLWDFDDMPYISIMHDLQYLQRTYLLPNIYVLESSENHYHAYCFCKRSFREIIHILSDTSTIDLKYFMLGIARGYYTLRFSKKGGKDVQIYAILTSDYEVEMSPHDIIVNEYFTTNI